MLKPVLQPLPCLHKLYYANHSKRDRVTEPSLSLSLPPIAHSQPSTDPPDQKNRSSAPVKPKTLTRENLQQLDCLNLITMFETSAPKTIVCEEKCDHERVGKRTPYTIEGPSMKGGFKEVIPIVDNSGNKMVLIFSKHPRSSKNLVPEAEFSNQYCEIVDKPSHRMRPITAYYLSRESTPENPMWKIINGYIQKDSGTVAKLNESASLQLAE